MMCWLFSDLLTLIWSISIMSKQIRYPKTQNTEVNLYTTVYYICLLKFIYFTQRECVCVLSLLRKHLFFCFWLCPNDF